jgi:hypothetical protein
MIRYLYQDMGCLPELAPGNENHLLRSATEIQRTHTQRIAPKVIGRWLTALSYSSWRLRRASPAAESHCLFPTDCAADGWLYNRESQVLLVGTAILPWK